MNQPVLMMLIMVIWMSSYPFHQGFIFTLFFEVLKIIFSLAENEAEVRSIVGDDVASHIFGHAHIESDNISVVGSAGNPPSSEPMDLDDNRSTISSFSSKSGASSAGTLRSIDMYTGNNKVTHKSVFFKTIFVLLT